MFIYMKYMSEKTTKNKHSKNGGAAAEFDKIGKIDPII